LNSKAKQKFSLSEDLTIVLLRGNGSPRSFRVPMSTIQRSVLTVSLLLATSFAAALLFFGLTLLGRDLGPAPRAMAPATPTIPEAPPPLPITVAAPKPEGAATEPSLWQKFSSPAQAPAPVVVPAPAPAPAAPVAVKSDEGEQAKEIAGLHEDIARLNAKLENRKDLPDSDSETLLQFLGPKSPPVPAAEATVKIENVVFSKDPTGKEVYVDFDLRNIDPEQRQARGRIVVLAKTTDAIATYPPNVFSPTQNILLNFAKGETFAISHGRKARANFKSEFFGGKAPNFQILLFTNDGRILANTHAEDSKR